MKKISYLALGALLFALCFSAEAQQPAKVPRIGFVAGDSAPSRARSRHSGKVCASLVTLRGKISSLSIDTAEGKLDRVPALAAELVRLKVDVIFTQAIATRAAKQATKTIPIVMARTPIRSARAWSPVLRDLAEISLDCRPLPGPKRKTAGTTEGDCSQALSVAVLRNFDQPGIHKRLKRGMRREFEGTASIP